MMHKSLFSGARKAARLAREWERINCPDEAKRARERAAYYLRSRKWILKGLNEARKETSDVRPEA